MNEDLKKYIRNCTLAVIAVVGISGIMDHIEHKEIIYKTEQAIINQRIQDSNDPNGLYSTNINKID